jgi:DNA-binding transcriptional regulator YiaG
MKALRERLRLNQREFAEALSAIPLREIGGRLGDVRALTGQRVADYESGRRNPDRLMKRAMEILEKR